MSKENNNAAVTLESKPRETWSGRVGFVFATAGSAVGLGNIMKFPWMTGQYGGAAFLFTYIIVMAIVGVGMLMCDFLIGRNGKANAIASYQKINKYFPWMGYLGLLCALLALAYYAVFGGWMMYYMLASFGPLSQGLSADQVGAFFGNFTGAIGGPLLGTAIFLILTVLIVMRGIKNGIEKASRIMMPLLLVILVILMARVIMLPGASKGISYYLKPDFSKITFTVVAAAVGQVFFSLNIGTTGMVNYGSYLKDDENVPKSTLLVTLTDFAVAFCAGFIVIPAAFAFGLEPGQGPGLLFVTMPALFSDLPLGGVWNLLFFTLLLFASLTSSVSILEILVPYLTETFPTQFNRKSASVVGGILCMLLGIPVSFSFGIWGNVQIFGLGIFDLYDRFICVVGFPLIALGTAILVGWVWGKQNAMAAISNHGTLKSWVQPVWFFLVKWICPIFLFVVVLSGLGIIK